MSTAMLKIRMLKDRHVVETIDAKWTIDIAQVAAEADRLTPQHGADDWAIVNEADALILTKSRWNTMKR